MATYKRRIVYLSDEEWSTARLQAEALDLTVSAYIRMQIAHTRETQVVHRDMANAVGFNTRPFTPVPKKAR